MNAPALEVHDLVVRYPGRDEAAVDGVSFSAAASSVLALLGPNGAGKTSTVETLEGYKRPTSGSVRVLGLDPISQARELMPHIGVMLQRNGVYLSMGPAQVLQLFGAYYGAKAKRTDEVLELVGLTSVAKTPWRRLSGGEQQRLSLGMALIGQPKVLFLDEPTAGMDPAGRQTLWTVIRQLRADGATMLLTTHYLDEAERLADQVVIVDKGHVVAAGTPDELRSGGTDDIRFSATPGLEVASLQLRVEGAVVTEPSPGEYHAAVAPTPQNISAITAWLADQNVTLGDLRGGRQRLEDVFVRLTNEPSTADTERATKQTSQRTKRGTTS
jgi:ABC-2 type transport system ATP-binding protein